ncbi:MAG TPA: DUF58 domain-containing protein [Geobacteraceae bacterium]|nr:DUF58 domain-containing protein [Geobacteraceae bacterium]
MGFAAVNTGNNLLFLVVSSLLGFMAVSGLAGWLNIRRIRVVVNFPDEIYAGKETFVPVRLGNLKKRLPSFLLRVNVLDRNIGFPLVESGGEESAAVTVTFRERGESLLDRVTVSSPFPINFFTRTRTLAVDSRCIVFPAPRRCGAAEGAGRKDVRGAAFSHRPGYGGDIGRIRDYGGSDPLKLIHWRLSARHDDLKVKEYTASAETPLVIDVHALPAGTIEESLSCAVYLVNKAARAGRPVGLKLGGRFLKPDHARAHRLRLLRELAVYGKS